MSPVYFSLDMVLSFEMERTCFDLTALNCLDLVRAGLAAALPGRDFTLYFELRLRVSSFGGLITLIVAKSFLSLDLDCGRLEIERIY